MKTSILLCGLNWLGDSVMSMPAIQHYGALHPETEIVMLVKSGLEPLWQMHPSVSRIIRYIPTVRGTLGAAADLRRNAFREAYVFPNSFRAALVPFLGRIPKRRGLPGHERRFLLSEVAEPPSEPHRKHQAWEYLRILDIDRNCDELPPPALSLPEYAQARVIQILGTKRTACIGIIPGAAYGPSKRWPAEYYAQAGNEIARRTGGRIIIFGSRREESICNDVAQAVSPAINLAGQTSMAEFAAGLSRCDVVICNDSGGMHLASAVGANVVAVFGITDPEKTGPLGRGHRVVSLPDVEKSRDLARTSDLAAQCLRRIEPASVVEIVLDVLSSRQRAVEQEPAPKNDHVISAERQQAVSE